MSLQAPSCLHSGGLKRWERLGNSSGSPEPHLFRPAISMSCFRAATRNMQTVLAVAFAKSKAPPEWSCSASEVRSEQQLKRRETQERSAGCLCAGKSTFSDGISLRESAVMDGR